MRRLIFSIFFIVLAGCSTPQHIRKDNYYRYDWSVSGAATGQMAEAQKHHPIFAHIEKISLEGPPTYERDANYFVFGFFPRAHEVKMSEACGDQPFRQAYIDHSFLQATVSFFTLGIYTPRTIQVWCGNEKTTR